MTGRVQTLRSNVAGNRPSGRQPGELYVNWPDKQLGVVDSTSTAMDLLAVRFFSTTTNYNKGDYVVQGGNLYSALGSVSAGAFNPAQWGLTGGNVAVGDTAPANPNVGQLWFDSVGGQLYVWYNDGNTTQWVIATNAAKTDLSSLVPLAGGTMTGPLILSADPTQALGAATKQYVDGVRWGDNRLINGDMRIDQRFNGAGGSVNGYVLDRWYVWGSQAGKFTNIARTTASAAGIAAHGFGYAFVAVVPSTAYTPLAADVFSFGQPIEADMITDFQWGTASAQPVTLSFWAYGPVAGTYSGALRNYAGTRSYPFTFTLPATTWTKVAVTIPGDPAGTWVLQGNAGALFVHFDLGTGANGRGPANAWASANYYGVTGSVSLVSSASGVMNFTGVKLEIGSVATPFNHQSLTKSLADCQRYYQTQNFVVGGYNAGGQNIYIGFPYATTMRAVPTITTSGVATTNSSFLTPSASVNYTQYNITITGTGYGYVTGQGQMSAEL